MALKEDCEQVREKAGRILALLRFRLVAKVEIEENSDLSVTVTPAMRQEWVSRFQALQAEIKSIVSGW